MRQSDVWLAVTTAEQVFSLASSSSEAATPINPADSSNLMRVRNGSWAAVRHNARMLQQCLSKRTLCQCDCGLLQCHIRTFAANEV